MSYGPYEDDDDERDRRETEEEWAQMEADPYSDDEKDQMGSSEYFRDND